ncbi:hypothetical protein DV515_00012646 [Chloebia gouldiae]|uniref:Uncharacterized protein n=1 Tax=Chloebia gouldiae TaxID=44316 RepID=A0A3L8S4A6_CHLGU|nr:hypothetical protein DV515_00012646 [Chloebia gouldiae]
MSSLEFHMHISVLTTKMKSDVSSHEENMMVKGIAKKYPAPHEVSAMLKAAETYGHGKPLPQKPKGVQPASDEMLNMGPSSSSSSCSHGSQFLVAEYRDAGCTSASLITSDDSAIALQDWMSSTMINIP